MSQSFRHIAVCAAALSMLSLGAATTATAEHHKNPVALAIHGGAGTITRDSMTPEREAEYRASLEAALDAGYEILDQGGSGLDAVIAAVQVMEANPLFNAGKGAVYTYDGTHELDASIMEGKSRNAGAVAGVSSIKSPIAAARTVMEESRHVMLSGAGAEQFAAEQGLEQVENSYFNTEHRHQQLQRALERLQRAEDAEQVAWNEEGWDPAFNMGTVGAVALDKDGNLYAATSTGGMTAKQYGRIGDSPIIGSGTYADNDSCAISSTGHGEYFIRYQVAADICARVKYQGMSIEDAGNHVIHDVLLPAGGTGGVIIVDGQGNIAMPFNTEGMYRASRSSNQDATVSIYKEE